VRVAALADVLKVVLYVIASLLLAAIISPYLYEIGKGFANVTRGKDTADQVTWLASRADSADFASFFKRALFLSAIICLIPLFYSLDLRRHARQRKRNPWTVGLPPNSIPPKMGQPLEKVRWGILQSLTGFCLAAGFALALAWFLFALNWFDWERQPGDGQLWKSISKSIKPALWISVLEELVFRGALLGIFLRAFRPSIAIVLLSLIFAAIHFLSPPQQFTSLDPHGAGAGFAMLALIGQKFLQLDLIIHSFISLFLVGVILGIARYRTASLWLPIGLLAGWIFSDHLFARLAERRTDFPEKFDLYIGQNLGEGLLPIGCLIMTGIAVAVYLKFSNSPPKTDLQE
jgi:uncharacterized protein